LIREQQDAEYEASLAADKARAEQAAAAREEEERIARQQAEREAAEKAALEAEQQAAAERAKALAARQTASAAALPSEPPPGPDAVQVRDAVKHRLAPHPLTSQHCRSCFAFLTESGCSAASTETRPQRMMYTDGQRLKASPRFSSGPCAVNATCRLPLPNSLCQQLGCALPTDSVRAW